MKCGGSGQPPRNTTAYDVVYPSGRTVAVRGACWMCGKDISLVKPASQRPTVRSHQLPNEPS